MIHRGLGELRPGRGVVEMQLQVYSPLVWPSGVSSHLPGLRVWVKTEGRKLG